MKLKKCCYFDRDCTTACVAYSAASELSEGARNLGMNDMHCMRLLLELTSLMNMDSESFQDEDAF